MNKKEILETREALMEMYKAGFLDGYRIKNRVKKKDEWALLNKFYKLAFVKRFGKKIDKELKKKKCKEVKRK